MWSVTLVPAYGRDYRNKRALLADWLDGKDFIIQSIGHPYDGKPMNKEQAQDGTYAVRYDAKRKIAVL
jgi:hypothetical protein